MDYIPIAVAAYILLNLLAALMFISDKRKAVNNTWRTPEKTLLTAAFFGPFGAFAGMRFAHHKTQKTKFKLVNVFMGLHIIVIAAILFLTV